MRVLILEHGIENLVEARVVCSISLCESTFSEIRGQIPSQVIVSMYAFLRTVRDLLYSHLNTFDAKNFTYQ